MPIATHEATADPTGGRRRGRRGSRAASASSAGGAASAGGATNRPGEERTDGRRAEGNAPTAGTRWAARAVDATKVYGDGDTQVLALDRVSVQIAPGTFTAVMGPSGSGKSTLMHCLAGLDTLTSGQVFIRDQELSGLSDRALTKVRRDQLGFIFQAFNLLPTLSAAENITLPLDLARRSPDAAWLEQVIATVGLQDRLNHRPSELSGGQQQRVAVARALAGKPDVVFADEPTGNLDRRSGTEVLSFLRAAVDGFGQTVVMVTHDPVAASYADAVLFLADGRIVDQLDHPNATTVLDRMKALGD